MKNIIEYITESKTSGITKSGFKTIAKSLTEDEIWFVKNINKLGQKYSGYSEGIEQVFWKGEYKENWEGACDRVIGWLERGGMTPAGITEYYSLARSGKQNKIEVAATVLARLYYDYMV